MSNDKDIDERMAKVAGVFLRLILEDPQRIGVVGNAGAALKAAIEVLLTKHPHGEVAAWLRREADDIEAAGNKH